MFDRKEYMKEYMKKSPHGKKTNTISKWKTRGLKETKEFIEQIYQQYLLSEECELCGNSYKNSIDKQMEHNHLTGKFRNICCKKCNLWKADRVGKNICWDKFNNNHKVQIRRNGKYVLQKSYKTEEEALEVLNQFILDNPHYFT